MRAVLQNIQSLSSTLFVVRSSKRLRHGTWREIERELAKVIAALVPALASTEQDLDIGISVEQAFTQNRNDNCAPVSQTSVSLKG